MELRSVLVLCLVSLALLATVSGGRSKKWQCHHKSSKAPVRHVHLGPAYRPLRNRVIRIDQPFRISVYYDPALSQTLRPPVEERLRQVVSNLVDFFQSTIRVRPTAGPIILDRDCQDGAYYLAPRRCKFSCIPTMCGEIQIPDQHLKACSQCFGDSTNCQTTGSDGPGVTNADFVLYVSAITTSSCDGSTIAYASHCHLEDAFDRPISGYANFCPDQISDSDVTEDFVLAVAKHEILHALVFSSGLYPFWRDENGNPRTPRDAFGQPPIDPIERQYVASPSTLRTVTYNNWQTRSGPVSHNVTQLVTPKIVAEGARHFNCCTLQGVEVENQGGPGTAMSHWEKRILENEGMTGIISPNPIFSTFTFALMEDSGWYRVDYSKAEQLLWGKNAGCDLPAGSCGGYIQNRQNSGYSISPFCNRLRDVPPRRRGCTLDRTAISECSLRSHDASLPPEYQYFNSGENYGGSTGVNVDVSTVGGAEVPDYCPYQTGFSDGDCSTSSNMQTGINNPFAETYAEGSRCVEHGGSWTAGTMDMNILFSTYGSGCYQYSCSNGQVTLFVLGQAHLCPSDGCNITVNVTIGGVRHQGSLICPSCKDICYDDFDNCPAAAQIYDGFNSPPPGPTPDGGGCDGGGGDGDGGDGGGGDGDGGDGDGDGAISITPLLIPLLLLLVAVLVVLV